MKAKIAGNGYKFISACTLASVLLTTPVYAESPKNLSIIVNAPSTLDVGKAGNIKLTLTPYASADYLTVDVSSSGILQAS